VVAFALRLDQLVVRAWLGESSAGIYFGATRLIDLALFAGSATLLSLFPSLASSHQQSPAAFRERLQGQFDALSALGWIAALGCLVAGPWIIRVLYGSAYAGAGPILAVLGGAALLMLNAGVRWNYILLAASPLLSLAAAGLHVTTLAGLCLLLVPRVGAPGAAVAMLAACMVSGLLTSFLFPSLRPCAGPQIRGLLIVFTPGRWRALLRQFTE
jgi:PST family polysaccharide transporter